MKYIFFDFDGTIADTMLTFAKIYNRIAGKLKIKKVPESSLLIYKNKKPKDIIKELNISFYKLPILVFSLKKLLTKNIKNIKIFDNMDNILKDLYNKNYSLYIVSSNSKKNINLFIKKKNIDYFKGVYICRNVFKKNKVILNIMKKIKTNKDEVIYIGDEVRDIEACKKAGIKIIAAGWGYNDLNFLRKNNPDYSAETPNDILKILNNL